MKNRIFLDYNATTPLRDSVLEAMTEVLREGGNPSSVHQPGRRAHGRLERARTQVAALAGARATQVVFTSGGTEANNAALGLEQAAALVVSATEHDSVLAPAQTVAKRTGKPVRTLPTDANGLIDPENLRQTLAELPRPALVSIMLANNETGVIQPLELLVGIAHEMGAVFHCDAIQAAGKLPLDFSQMGVDMMTLSAHKLGGPPGVGALIVGEGLPFNAHVTGGGQEQGRRSGTENLSGIVGFGEAAEASLSEVESFHCLSDLRTRLETDIRQLTPAAVLVADSVPRLANTSCIILPGVAGETQVMHFDLAGIATSSGSACSSGKVKESHVLAAMGFDQSERGCALRISMGRLTQPSDIDRLVEAYATLVARKSDILADRRGAAE